MSDVRGTIVCDHRIGDPIETFTLYTCPRCSGKGVYGGIAFSPAGVSMLTPADSLMQGIKKILTENRRTSGYGFNYALLRGVIAPDTLTAINAEISRCLQYFRNIQQGEKARGYRFALSEELLSIDSISTVQDTSDPRRIIVTVSVSAVSGTQVSVTVPLRA